uniref:Uncharacterized protein n=1 Tax=Setaria italica TaxID=4555 RepID=K3Z1W8_SETIT
MRPDTPLCQQDEDHLQEKATHVILSAHDSDESPRNQSQSTT